MSITKKRIALEIDSPYSPAVVGHIANSEPAGVIAAKIQAAFRQAVADNLPGAEWTLDRPIVVKLHGSSGPVLPRDQQKKIDDKDLEIIRDAFALADAARQIDIDRNEHNGKLGWWKVDGVRHAAIVKADSERSAIDKANAVDAVQASWESPRATWIGEELPEVIEV